MSFHIDLVEKANAELGKNEAIFKFEYRIFVGSLKAG